MAALEAFVDGQKCKFAVKDDNIQIWSSEPKPNAEGSFVDLLTLASDDIICLKNEELLQTKLEKRVTVMHFIKRRDDAPEWVNATLRISPCSSKEDEYKQLVEDLQRKLDEVVTRRPKKILVLMNPIGGKGKAKKVYDTIVLPLFYLAGISVELTVSERQKHMIEMMSSYNFKSVDGIVMMGGDGTIHEVVNVLIRRTQEDAGIDINDSTAVLQPLPIPLSIIPTGSGNAVAAQLTGCKDVTTSTLHIIKGKCLDLDILSTHCDGKLVGYSTCVMGLGALCDYTNIADRKLRWMKASRYHAVVNMFPFRRVHYLETEISIRNSKTENHDTKDAQANADATEKDIINQRTSMLLALTMDIWWPGQRPKGKMLVAAFKEMGGIQMRRVWKDRIFQKNLDISETYEANSLTIRYKPRTNIPAVYNEMVCLDGELFTCSKPEYFVRISVAIFAEFCRVWFRCSQVSDDNHAMDVLIRTRSGQ